MSGSRRLTIRLVTLAGMAAGTALQSWAFWWMAVMIVATLTLLDIIRYAEGWGERKLREFQ